MEENTVDIAQTGRAATALGLCMIFSRLLGLVRDMLFAFLLGGGLVADIFFAAMRLPHVCRRLVQEGALALSFIPLFNKVKADGGKTAAFDFSRVVMWRIVVIGVILCLLCVYAADGIIVLIAPGIARAPEALHAASGLFAVMVFYIPLMTLAGVAACMLLALDKFRSPALASTILNVVMIAAALLVLLFGRTGLSAAWFLSVALVVGGAVQLVFQLPDLFSEGFRFKGPLPLNSSAGRSFLRNAPLAAVGAASYQLGVVISMVFASYLAEGSLTALYFAERLIEMPFNVVGVAIGTASLNTLSRLLLEDRLKEFSRHLFGTISFSLFLLLPATFGLLALGWPIVATFFGHGAFESDAVERTVVALTFYAPGLPAVAILRPLLSAANARGHAFITSILAVCSLGLLAVLAYMLMPRMGLAGIALSTSLAAWFNLLLLVLLLKRSMRREHFNDFLPWKNALIFLLFSLAMFALLMLLNLAAQQWQLGPVVRLVLGMPLGLVVYFGLCAFARRPELRFFLGTLRGRRTSLNELDNNA